MSALVECNLRANDKNIYASFSTQPIILGSDSLTLCSYINVPKN